MNTNAMLTIGVSSRALFNLEEANNIFEKEGVQAFREYQFKHEDVLLEKGTAYKLIKNLLHLNTLVDSPVVEVVVMSRNSSETGIRALNSIKAYGLSIERFAFTGGASLQNYISAFDVDLFLSKDADDIQKMCDADLCAAAHICTPPIENTENTEDVRIAFDADAVLFSEESEHRYKTEGLASFQKHESDHEHVELEDGPFANFLRKLSSIQQLLPCTASETPLRIAIVTARSAPAHLRVIKTLRKWNVHIDECFFIGGRNKAAVLSAFRADIFFDDQELHLEHTSKVVPSGKVPYKTNSKLNN
ncbi:5'-nucleotidase [Bacteroidota bacterium]